MPCAVNVIFSPTFVVLSLTVALALTSTLVTLAIAFSSTKSLSGTLTFAPKSTTYCILILVLSIS